MTTGYHPMDLYLAVSAVLDKQLDPCGNDVLTEFDRTVRSAVDRLGKAPMGEQQALAKKVVELLESTPEIYKRVATFTETLSCLRRDLVEYLKVSASDLRDDPELADQHATAVLQCVASAEIDRPAWRGRHVVTIKAGGVGEAHSRKLKNLKIDLSKLLELGAHTAIITIHEISHLNPLLLAFGVILLGRLGWEATAIKISEQEASVFWGLLKAQDEQSNGQSVSEAVVVAVTNRERGKDRNGVRLGAPLPQEAVRRSLESLEKIGSVVHEDEEGQSTRWRIAERYQVKNEGSRP